VGRESGPRDARLDKRRHEDADHHHRLANGVAACVGTAAEQVVPVEFPMSDGGSEAEECLRLRAQLEDQERQVAEERKAWEQERAWLYSELRNTRPEPSDRAPQKQVFGTAEIADQGPVIASLSGKEEQLEPELAKDRLRVKGMSAVGIVAGAAGPLDALPTFGDRRSVMCEPDIEPVPVSTGGYAKVVSPGGSDNAGDMAAGGCHDTELIRLKRNIKAAMDAMGRMENHKDLGSVVRELSNGCACVAPRLSSTASNHAANGRMVHDTYSREEQQQLRQPPPFEQRGHQPFRVEASTAEDYGMQETRRRLDQLFARASDAADRMFAGEALSTREASVSSSTGPPPLMHRSSPVVDWSSVGAQLSSSKVERSRPHERASPGGSPACPPGPPTAVVCTADNMKHTSSQEPHMDWLRVKVFPPDTRAAFGRPETDDRPSKMQQAAAVVPSPEVAAWDRGAVAAARGPSCNGFHESYCISGGGGSSPSIGGNFSSSACSAADGSRSPSPLASAVTEIADPSAPPSAAASAGNLASHPEGSLENEAEESRRLVKSELEKLREWYKSLIDSQGCCGLSCPAVIVCKLFTKQVLC